MYTPKYFEVTDDKEITAFIQANGFGQLTSLLKDKLFATHLPFLFDPQQNKLLGHLAKKNPQHGELNGQEVLVTLQGSHGYISPSWYSSPGVPTWNYQVVHIYGVCTVFDESEKLATLLNTLTEEYESTLPEPYEPDYNESLLNAIIGIEIDISKIQCKYKLSQNRTAEERTNIIQHLQAQNNHSLANVIGAKQKTNRKSE